MTKTVTIPTYSSQIPPPPLEHNRANRYRRWAASAFISVVLLLAFTGYIAADLLANTLLDEQNYTSALAKHDAYNRIYTEVLADPELKAVTQDLLANLKLDVGTSDQLFSFTVSTLRLLLPPDVIQEALEQGLTKLLDYLTGESNKLQANLDLSKALNEEDFADKLVASIQGYIAELLTDTQASLETIARDEYRTVLNEKIREVLASLEEGELSELPNELVLILGGDDRPDDERRVLIDTFLNEIEGHLTPEQIKQIEAALVAHDAVGAITLLIGVILEAVAENGIAELRVMLQDGGLDTLTALAEQAEESEQAIINELNRFRRLIILVDEAFGLVMSLVVSLCAAGLIWLYRDNSQYALRVIGITLFIAAGTVLLIWLVVGDVINSPALKAILTEESALPQGLSALISDVSAEIINLMWVDLALMILATASLGLLLIIFSLINLSAVFRGMQPISKQPTQALIVLMILVIFVPAVAKLIFGGGLSPKPQERRCNGHAALCDRPVNEVTFATTHNSMSISTYDWWWPSHDIDIPAQLSIGVRGLLIDTHYAQDLKAMQEYASALPPEVGQLVEGAFEASSLNTEELYLCHGMCALGNTLLIETLIQINQFLMDHPNEVIVIIIQDAISAEDTEQAFADSGLLERVYTHEPDTPWPTLNEMIDSDKRVIVMAEEAGPPPTWYLNAWDYTEETPYFFATVEDYTCVPNRGDTSKPFFLMNHWIDKTSPDRVDAVHSNTYDLLLNRAQACTEERGKTPNLIAVNFVMIGDTLAVVDTLNGVVPD